MPPQQQNPYDFILDNNQTTNKGGRFQNSKSRMLVSVVFVSIVILLAVLAVVIFTSLTRQSQDDVIDVVAYQTEIARITELGLKNAKDPATRTQLATISAFIVSDAAQTKSFLSSSGVNLKPEQLIARKDSQIDKQLETAAQLNKYDETLLNILSKKTDAYNASLRAALSASVAGSRKNTLDTAAKNIVVFNGKSQN